MLGHMECKCSAAPEVIKWFPKAVLLPTLPPAVTERPSGFRFSPTPGAVVFFILAMLVGML